MKKILIGALVFLASAATVTAGDMTLGVKGTATFSPSQNPLTEQTRKNTNPLAVVGGGGSVFFRYDFANADVGNGNSLSFGIQPEIGFHANFGTLYDVGATPAGKLTFNTVDVPVLLAGNMTFKKFRLSVAAGPNFAFSVGKAKINKPSQVEYKIAPFFIGLQAGIGLGFDFTEHSGIILEIRGLLDFNNLEQKATNLQLPGGGRRAALLSLGYAHTF